MKRIIRDKHLSDEEADKYAKVREQIEKELPDLVERHHQRMTWRTCPTHGDENPNVYGCAECLRELRIELETLTAEYNSVCDEVVRIFPEPNPADIPKQWNLYLIQLLRELAEIKEFRKVKSTPHNNIEWSLYESIEWLVKATDHLLSDHNCDNGSYERYQIAMANAKRWLSDPRKEEK